MSTLSKQARKQGKETPPLTRADLDPVHTHIHTIRNLTFCCLGRGRPGGLLPVVRQRRRPRLLRQLPQVLLPRCVRLARNFELGAHSSLASSPSPAPVAHHGCQNHPHRRLHPSEFLRAGGAAHPAGCGHVEMLLLLPGASPRHDAVLGPDVGHPQVQASPAQAAPALRPHHRRAGQLIPCGALPCIALSCIAWRNDGQLMDCIPPFHRCTDRGGHRHVQGEETTGPGADARRVRFGSTTPRLLNPPYLLTPLWTIMHAQPARDCG